MGRAFASHQRAEKFTQFEGAVFGDAVTAATKHVPDITWQELARYNWGTDVPREVNRVLVETIGCASVDDDDPTKTAFDPRLGPSRPAPILLPRPWAIAAAPVDRAREVRVRRRRPMPAISIRSLTAWFLPKEGTCELTYEVEGIRDRADKVDFEVHPSRYFQRNRKGGHLEPGEPHPDASSPHIVQHREIYTMASEVAPAAVQTYADWKGRSEATKGLLEDDGETYIDFNCAPYPVMLRLYKDDADKAAKLVLEPFHPGWKEGAIDERSLIARWRIADDNGKLRRGQLLLIDKDDQIRLRVGLSAAGLRIGKLALARLPREVFDPSTLEPSAAPYRIQIQAHSDEAEDLGLAIAVMHTAVKPLCYEKIQFVAYNARPGVTADRTGYLGKGTTDEDIDKRCETMIEAIRIARDQATDDPTVLKLFMGPEFYFRGEEGAYPVEKLSEIMARMLEETGKFEYADWLFQYGTAIGYLRHQGEATEFKPDGDYQMSPAVIEEVDQGGERTRLRVSAAQAYRIGPRAARVRWAVDQGPGCYDDIDTATRTEEGSYWLEMLNKKWVWTPGPAQLAEPPTTEVLNTAFVQRGWPCEQRFDNGLLRGLIYKEFISGIDFLGPNYFDTTAFYDKSGWGRRLKLHGVVERITRPVAGSTDLLAQLPNPTSDGPTWIDAKGGTHTVGSEINASGEGGGSVITVDGIAFGIEVCLDHAYRRLQKFYDTTAKSGDPRVQVQLIPSWGMSIGGGPVVTVDEGPNLGLTFNVDGSRCGSSLRVNDGTYGCDLHPSRTSGSEEVCGELDKWYVCETCGDGLGPQPVECIHGHGLGAERHICAGAADFYACPICWWHSTDPTQRCPDHQVDHLTAHLCNEPTIFRRCAECDADLGHDPATHCAVHPQANRRTELRCATCNGGYAVGRRTCREGHETPWRCYLLYDVSLGQCSRGHSNPVPCGLYRVPSSPQCDRGHSELKSCDKVLKPIGSDIAASTGRLDVPGSHDRDYYGGPAHVLLYAPQPIPTPARVP